VEGLAANKTVKHLVMSSAGLDGAASGRIAGALWESKSLEKLDLSGNNMSSSGAPRP
jgi:Ran GTPase-activating protein (RanGAP) involved in mRNA processing and transport